MSKFQAVFLVSISLAMGAHAQGSRSGVTESTDPAKAAAVEQAARDIKARSARDTTSAQQRSSAFIVRGQTEAGLAYLSGGTTVEDRVTMYAERARFSLWVATVAKGSGAYLSDARLRIVNLNDKGVAFDRTMDGPWFFLALPAGRYEITATVPPDGADAAQTLATRISIPHSGQRQAVLRFVSSATVSAEMESPFKGNPFSAPPSAK